MSRLNLKLPTSTKASDKQVGGEHYKTLPIQPGKFIRANGIGWYEGNAIKYITRYKQKGGRKDIEKAIHYLELLLEEYDEETPTLNTVWPDDSFA